MANTQQMRHRHLGAAASLEAAASRSSSVQPGGGDDQLLGAGRLDSADAGNGPGGPRTPSPAPAAVVRGGSLPPPPSSRAGDAVVLLPDDVARASIYHLYTPRRRNVILLAAAFTSVLVPFCDTVYLPALAVIQTDLKTSPELVAASVSIYMFVVGLAALVWGPASDRFGRMPTYMVACAAFIGASLGCVFAPTAVVLVLFRALQGAGVSAFLTSGSGVIADIFPPEVRGTASGIFMIPLLIGPVIGPLLGGGLSQAFGWRSTFVALTAFCVLAGAVVLLLIRRETHQYFVLRRLAKHDPESAKGMAEYEAVMAQPPVFDAPWVPLRYLLEPAVVPHALVGLVTFATMFGMLTELPSALADAPYHLPAGLIGVSYLADGLSGLVGSPVGGMLSDKSAARHPHEPEARLVHNTLIAMVTMPSGLLGYAWALHARLHLAVIMAAMVLTGFGCAAYLPGLFGYLTTLKQSAAAAASAAVQSMMFVSAGVIILVSAVATRAMGYGPWFTLLAGIQACVSVPAYVIILRKQRAAAAVRSCSQEAPLPPAPGPHGDLEAAGVAAADVAGGGSLPGRAAAGAKMPPDRKADKA